jgi:hypothetical protein
MKRPIENNSAPGQAVYEPFSGSGTTIIAAEMTGRACHAIELNPAYVDVAIRRWQDFSGQEAVLECSGLSFRSVAVERGVDQPRTANDTFDETTTAGREHRHALDLGLSLPDDDLPPPAIHEEA